MILAAILLFIVGVGLFVWGLNSDWAKGIPLLFGGVICVLLSIPIAFPHH